MFDGLSLGRDTGPPMATDDAFQGHLIPQAASDWAQKCVGPFQVLRCCRLGSRRTGVWELRSQRGHHYLKLNRRRVRWGTEVFVYTNWADALRPFAPELQGVLDEDGYNGLLVGSLEGSPLRETKLPDGQVAKAYAKAGELCARLHHLATGSWFGIANEHGQAVNNDGVPLREPDRDPVLYYRRCIGESLQAAEAAHALDSAEKQTVDRVIDSLTNISFPSPVPTSFDYTPGNWIVDEVGNFRGLIDFENMAWGLAADPFARLLIDYFPNNRRCAEAFYAGYGSRPPQEDRDQVRIGCLLYALLYKTLAAERGSAKDAERGQRAFALCSF
jgi:hypothetical protein